MVVFVMTFYRIKNLTGEKMTASIKEQYEFWQELESLPQPLEWEETNRRPLVGEHVACMHFSYHFVSETRNKDFTTKQVLQHPDLPSDTTAICQHRDDNLETLTLILLSEKFPVLEKGKRLPVIYPSWGMETSNSSLYPIVTGKIPWVTEPDTSARGKKLIEQINNSFSQPEEPTEHNSAPNKEGIS